MKRNDAYGTNTLAINDPTRDGQDESYSHAKTGTLVSVFEIAEIFQVHVRTAQRWTSKDLIPYYRIGSVIRYDLTQVLNSVERTHV